MSTKDLMESLHTGVYNLKQGGGVPALTQRRERGLLTARERLDLLFDSGTFCETGLWVRPRSTGPGMAGRELPADGVVTGFGKVEGRTVGAFSQDFTVMGGSLGEMHGQKIIDLQTRVRTMGCPIVGLQDSGGARIQEGIDSMHAYGRIFYNNTVNSGVVPQIAVILGPTAGGAAYSPALTDFIFMVEGVSTTFLTGPAVIRAVTGERITQEELGGARVHAERSGVAHFVATDERQCLTQVRRLLSFLPRSNAEGPPRAEPGREPSAPADHLIAAVSTGRPYDSRELISSLVDQSSFLEVHAGYARNIVIGFARLGGHAVGMVANQPAVCSGLLDTDACDKAARFIRFCDAFNIPLLTLASTPGFVPAMAQEHGGLIRHAAKLVYAYAEASVPKLVVNLGGMAGAAYIAMCPRSLGADLAVAWPSAAAPGEAVVIPADTRCALIAALHAAGAGQRMHPARKHGLFPV